jgi:hypothetical protein
MQTYDLLHYLCTKTLSGKMDIVALTTLLIPCSPFLIKLGEKAAESASSKIGTDAWETAKKIWDKL